MKHGQGCVRTCQIHVYNLKTFFFTSARLWHKLVSEEVFIFSRSLYCYIIKNMYYYEFFYLIFIISLLDNIKFLLFIVLISFFFKINTFMLSQKHIISNQYLSFLWSKSFSISSFTAIF